MVVSFLCIFVLFFLAPLIRYHPLSTYVKVSEKLIYVTPWYAKLRWQQNSELFEEAGVFRCYSNRCFAIFPTETVWSLFLTKKTIFIKKDSNIGNFLWILWVFKNSVFLNTSGGCFCIWADSWWIGHHSHWEISIANEWSFYWD